MEKVINLKWCTCTQPKLKKLGYQVEHHKNCKLKQKMDRFIENYSHTPP